jgi:hypothetical protein
MTANRGCSGKRMLFPSQIFIPVIIDIISCAIFRCGGLYSLEPSQHCLRLPRARMHLSSSENRVCAECGSLPQPGRLGKFPGLSTSLSIPPQNYAPVCGKKVTPYAAFSRAERPLGRRGTVTDAGLPVAKVVCHRLYAPGMQTPSRHGSIQSRC